MWHDWSPCYYLSKSQWRARQYPPQHGHQVRSLLHKTVLKLNCSSPHTCFPINHWTITSILMFLFGEKYKLCVLQEKNVAYDVPFYHSMLQVGCSNLLHSFTRCLTNLSPCFCAVDWDTRSKGFSVMATQMNLLLPLWSTAWRLMKVECKNIPTTRYFISLFKQGLSNPKRSYSFHRNHHHFEGRLCPCS